MSETERERQAREAMGQARSRVTCVGCGASLPLDQLSLGYNEGQHGNFCRRCGGQTAYGGYPVPTLPTNEWE